MDYFLEKCQVHTDDRGDLIQFITQDFLSKHHLPFGQIYFISFNGKGVVRGNHYHRRSKEAFCLISGTVEVAIQCVKTNTKKVFQLSHDSKHYQLLFIAENIAHAIVSLSDDAWLLCYSSVVYSEADDDKHPFQIL